MRRSGNLAGPRSMFSRGVRRVKVFFGWLQRDGEADQEALEQTAAVQETSDADAEKSKRGDGGDDDGSGDGGVPVPRYGHKHKEDDAEEKPEPKSGYDLNGKPINYAKPPDMPEDEWERRKEAERQRRDDERRLEQRRKAQKQRQRITQIGAEAKVRDEREKESLQAKLERLKASLPPEETKPDKDDCEFGL